MAMVYREMSEELEQYVNCFTDEPQLLTAYRDIVRKSFSGDVLGEALLQL
jgi:hypothetical protein